MEGGSFIFVREADDSTLRQAEAQWSEDQENGKSLMKKQLGQLKVSKICYNFQHIL